MEYDEAINKIAEEKEIKLFKSVVDIHTENASMLIENFEPNEVSIWNLEYNPVKYDMDAVETAELHQFTQSDDELVNKVVLSLCSICKEMHFLAKEAIYNLFDPLLLYYDLVKATNYGGVSHSCIIEILPVLIKVSNYITQVIKVVENVLLQLNALYVHKSSRMINIDDTHFQVVFEHLAELLSILIIFDEIKRRSLILEPHFRSYRQLIDSAEADVSAFEVDKADVLVLRNMINTIDDVFFSDCILKYVLESLELSIVRKNMILKEEFLTVTLGWSSQIDNGIMEGNNNDLNQIMRLTALSILYIYLYDHKDKRLIKTLFCLYKKSPSISLVNTFAWKGESYVKDYFPPLACMVSNDELAAIKLTRKTYLEEKLVSLSEEVQISTQLVRTWMVKLEATSYIASNKLTQQGLLQREALFRQINFYEENLMFILY